MRSIVPRLVKVAEASIRVDSSVTNPIPVCIARAGKGRALGGESDVRLIGAMPHSLSLDQRHACVGFPSGEQIPVLSDQSSLQ